MTRNTFTTYVDNARTHSNSYQDSLNDLYRRYLCELEIYQVGSYQNVLTAQQTTTEKKTYDNHILYARKDEKDIMPKNQKFVNVKRIKYSGPATIVFWEDRTKTVVRCSENDKKDPYNASCAALAIKLYGSNSHLKKVIQRAEDK